ncbi:transcriptional regulator [Sphaerisporangium melleum]|uniref:Transcriptional regulator n=1 Tax=Sphaerisporangium melleum TaxID=321316 RepID=A0A917VRC2_9ACTN|nr:helix-turn-helix domain-containing protein [Sphaerisporangium melleum]GGL10138.1 transcriptional regulator [Sphaerisporangium melleum]GII70774.1 transcriptional regulator [Sphaerisporangium melleum]
MPGYEPDFCPRYHSSIELIGKRWTGVILRELLRGASRFSQLSNAIPDITDKLLAERLKELEAAGVVERRIYPETPVRIEYVLTEKGRDLEGVVREVSRWAEHWLPPVPANPEA